MRCFYNLWKLRFLTNKTCIIVLTAIFAFSFGFFFASLVSIYFSRRPSHWNLTPHLWSKDSYEFFILANKSVSDKFHAHAYQYAYAKYLSPLRQSKVKILEIGLGCNMPYGPGKSLELWLEYFSKDAEIWYFEINGLCLNKTLKNINASNVHGYVGDQANVQHLKEFVTVSQGQFDIIIDDGLHGNIHQQRSLQVLFPTALKLGGYYFIEDLFFSYLKGIATPNVYGGYRSNDNNTLERITNILENLMLPDYLKSFLEHTVFALPSAPIIDKFSIESIDCFHRMCVLVKRSLVNIHTVMNEHWL